jgi:hypothetical protein
MHVIEDPRHLEFEALSIEQEEAQVWLTSLEENCVGHAHRVASDVSTVAKVGVGGEIANIVCHSWILTSCLLSNERQTALDDMIA